MSKHLERKHNISWNKSETEQIDNYIADIDMKEVTRFLSIAIAQTTAPYRIVENEYFKLALKSLNRKYSLPSHQTIARTISKIHVNMQEAIRTKISKAENVSICADFWTGKDSLGYIGISASFIEEYQLQTFLIALRHVPHPHTALCVRNEVDNVLNEYGIIGLHDPKLFSVSTDNGSNMVAGLSLDVIISTDDVEMNKDTYDEEGEAVIDLSCDEEPGNEPDDIFECLLYNKRIPCVNHILNNNIKNAVLKIKGVIKTLNEAKEVIRKLKGKGSVNDYFKQNNLPKLILPPLTRWQYFSQMCNSLLKIKDHMPTLCNIAKINNITIEAYEEIEKLNKTFILYSEITLKFEKNDAKLSDVIPEFLSLIINLDKPGMHPQLTSALKTDLIYRTECIFNTQSKNFNPIFGLATFLDPTNRKYLNI